ncbi:hypothetical protein FOL47_008638 [Perkinsus chesapeaki]|uniref:CHK kinase-like domain-containing protein n=1 Tax=Perkinsus chesapeaki TaxID=330153 RepID=A0A7J6LCQ2_PERCH|nr:hypothetical protein FOL47_008638 [Perkinsus chesapeaki]
MSDSEEEAFHNKAAADELERKVEVAEALKVMRRELQQQGLPGWKVKYLPAKGPLHDFCLELDVYDREQNCLAFYNEAGIHDKLRSIPDCHLYLPGLYYSDDKMIAMDDLVESHNFEPYKMEDPMDFSLAADCIKALAYFHAVLPIEAARSRFLKPREATYRVMGQILNEGIADLKEGGDSLLSPSVVEVIEENRDFIQSVMVGNPDKLTVGDAILVVAHEDMWSNNIMTHQRPDGTTEIAIVDHQFPEVDTPSVDIVFFIFCSMAVEARRAHMKDLFQLYADTFSAASKEYPSSEQVWTDITSATSLRRGAAKAIGMMISGESGGCDLFLGHTPEMRVRFVEALKDLSDMLTSS